MKLINTLIKFKIKKSSFAIGTIAVAGIIGLFSFFNYHDRNEISERTAPVPVADQISNNVPTHLKSDTPASIDDYAAGESNEQLNSRNSNFADMNENQGEALQERLNDPEPGESSKSNDSMDLKELFKDSVINKHTLRVTQMLQNKFSDSAAKNFLAGCIPKHEFFGYLP